MLLCHKLCACLCGVIITSLAVRALFIRICTGLAIPRSVQYFFITFGSISASHSVDFKEVEQSDLKDDLLPFFPCGMICRSHTKKNKKYHVRLTLFMTCLFNTLTKRQQRGSPLLFVTWNGHKYSVSCQNICNVGQVKHRGLIAPHIHPLSFS